jgi:hypothetical protein
MAIPLNTRLKRALMNDDAGPRPYIYAGTSVTTAGAATYTAAGVFGGLILRDPAGADRTDTLPTAALLVAYLKSKANEMGVQLPVYVAFDFIVQNDADAAETITVQAGSGGTNTSGHTRTIAQSNSKKFNIILNTVAQTYDLRNLGGYTT